MLSSRSHIFHDKENILAHKTPARFNNASSAQLQGFKTVGKAPTTGGGKTGMGREGSNKLTMTTRTGKGGEKKAGKGGGEEGALIEPKRLFGTTKTNSSTPYVQPSLSFSTSIKPSNTLSKSANMSLSNSLSVPPSQLPPSHLKTPARPTSSKSNSTPLPSAGRTRRRSMKLHSTPIKDVTFSTPVGPRMAPGELSFEMDDVADLGMGELGLVEEGEQEEEESGDDEVEYMPPSAIVEPFSLPYDCMDAKTLGTRLRQMPLFLPSFDGDEDAEIPVPDVVTELQEGGGWTIYELPVKEIESDDEFNLNLSRRPRAPPSTVRPASKAAGMTPSTGVKRTPGSTLPSRRPLSSAASSTVRSTTTGTASSSSLRRPPTSSTSKPSTLRSTRSPPAAQSFSTSSSTFPPSSRRPAAPATVGLSSSSSSSLRRSPTANTSRPVTTSSIRSRPALPSSFTFSAKPKPTLSAAASAKAAENAMFPSSLDALSSLTLGPDSFLVDDKEGMFEL